jgi:hypothetical protein
LSRKEPSLPTVVHFPQQGPVGPSVSGASMNSIIYIVGLIVVVLAILSFLGLR